MGRLKLTALGYGYPDGSFYLVGGSGIWWSATDTEFSTGLAYGWSMHDDDDYVGKGYGGKSSLLSVRCVKD